MELYNNLNKIQQLFWLSLPNFPYCSNNFLDTKTKPRSVAVYKKYIQLNNRFRKSSIVLDIDKDGITEYDAMHNGLPTPNMISRNPLNNHCHMFWILKNPVAAHKNARSAPLDFYKSILDAFTRVMGADLSYGNFLSKNFLNDTWLNVPLSSTPYELSYLSEHVELRKKPEKEILTGGGRNCENFDETRLWAYKQIYHHQTHDSLFDAIFQKVSSNNNFENPLPHSEVKSISKSIAKWVWGHRFEIMQRKTEKAKKSINIRWGENHTLKNKALKLAESGYNTTQIAKKLNKNRKTIRFWLRRNGDIQHL